MAETEEKPEKKGFAKRLGAWIKGIIDPREYDSKISYIFMLIFIGLVVIMVGMYLYTLLGYIDFIPIGDTEFLTNIVVRFFLAPMVLIGPFGFLLFLGFMAVQAIILAIPSELVMVTAGMVWGWLVGGILNILGGMVAAIVLFYLARRGGKPFVVKSVGEKTYKVIDNFITKYGFWAVLIGRMVPFVPLDLISTVSGVVEIKWRDYLIGSAIGVVIRGFFYAWIGWLMLAAAGVDSTTLIINMIYNPGLFEAQIEQLSLPFNFILGLTVVGVFGAFGVYYLYMRRQGKKLDAGSVNSKVQTVPES